MDDETTMDERNGRPRDEGDGSGTEGGADGAANADAGAGVDDGPPAIDAGLPEGAHGGVSGAPRAGPGGNGTPVGNGARPSGGPGDRQTVTPEAEEGDGLLRDGSPGLRRGVVVVTGGTAGVGRATVRAFARAGWDVAILARGRDGLRGAVADVAREGRRGLGIPTDVAEHDEVEAAADRVEAELGMIDVWVNNAMTTIFSPFWEIEPREYERATRVTYLGAVWGTRVALALMRPRNRGTIVQVGSALSYRGIPLQAPYCGAKHAMRGFTDSLRSELIHEGSEVDLVMVQLPGLNTPQFSWCRTNLPNHPKPVPPIYQPEVAADAVLWAAEHPGQREVWVGLPSWKTIVGQKVSPRFLDHYLANNAWEGQQTPDPVAADRPSNLFEPVPGDHGAHGEFDGESKDDSTQMALSKRRRMILGGAALAAAGAFAVGMLTRDDDGTG